MLTKEGIKAISDYAEKEHITTEVIFYMQDDPDLFVEEQMMEHFGRELTDDEMQNACWYVIQDDADVLLSNFGFLDEDACYAEMEDAFQNLVVKDMKANGLWKDEWEVPDTDDGPTP